ncbi:MAG: diguanylate cyclase [Rugosibacter sp.]|nr:diguanylate cyclase [Rugosibacter sp.]
MSKPSSLSPLEVARETLRSLALQKLQPTPDNYRTVFHEISGIVGIEAFPETELKSLQAELPRQNAKQINFVRQVEAAIAQKSWQDLKLALVELSASQVESMVSWADLIRRLLRQLETSHEDLADSQKKQALEHVLSASGTGDLLFSRLQSLISAWERQKVLLYQQKSGGVSGVAPQEAGEQAVSAVASVVKASPASLRWQDGWSVLQALVVQFLDDTLISVVQKKPELVRETREISAAVRQAHDAASMAGIAERLKRLSYRAHFAVEDDTELHATLLRLLRLIVDNISELVLEDQWLTGQVELIRNLLDAPLELRRLDEVESRIKDVVVKQGMLKRDLTAANDRLKLMLASFVDHLTNFSETTASYHGKVETFSAKISQARDVAEITAVLNEVIQETRIVQLDTARSRDELSLLQGRVLEAEQAVERLQKELSATTQLVRHDSLTGALNRKGLDEVLHKEIQRQKRLGGVLSVAFLDIDNFKQINDARGHTVGDAALVHLATIVQQTLRPQDVLARYGGEEFVVLLPDTPVDVAVQAMARVQRALTKNFFMLNDERILITFSCGVAEVDDMEHPEETLDRADAAMYLAKRSGKNRVVAA